MITTGASVWSRRGRESWRLVSTGATNRGAISAGEVSHTGWYQRWRVFPILTDYIWRARDNGARIIVIDPRMTPIAHG